VYAVSVSPDGKLLASSNQDGVVTLWDITSGQPVRTISASDAIVIRMAFSREGEHLATAICDRLAKVWDVRTGQELATFYGNNGDVFGVPFNPDGTRLATASTDGIVRIYTLKLDELVTLARSRLTRSFTPEECEKYLHVKVCPTKP
jgi:WD40 repeat protein